MLSQVFATVKLLIEDSGWSLISDVAFPCLSFSSTGAMEDKSLSLDSMPAFSRLTLPCTGPRCPHVTVLMTVPQDQEQVTAVLSVFMRFKTLWQVIKQLMICLLVPLIVV